MPDGSDWIVFESTGARMRLSGSNVVLEDHYLPRTVEISVNGRINNGPDPETYARVEVSNDGIPRLTELRFTSDDPDGPGIRQADLREVQVAALVEDLVAMYTIRIDRDPGGEARAAVTSLDDKPALLRFVGRMRSGRTARDITPELLTRVANVYRANIDRHPTKAVEHHFQVSQRMAAEYVSRARKRGLLPPTKRGKKNA